MKPLFSALFLFLLLGAVAVGCGGERNTAEDETAEQMGTTDPNAPGATPPAGDSDPTETGETTGPMAGETEEPGTMGTDTETDTGMGTGTAGMENTEQDAQLTASIKQRLQTEGIQDANNVEVETNNGVVTLTGRVSTEAEAQRIVNLVESMENVDRVENKLEVGG